MIRTILAASLVLVMACGTDSTLQIGSDEELAVAQDAEALERADDRFDTAFDAAGREFDVPPAVLKALSWSLTRYEMVEGTSEEDNAVARFGMMAIPESDIDAIAAQLRVDVAALKTDPATNIRGAAALLVRHAAMNVEARGQALSWAALAADYADLTDYDLRKAFIQGEFAATLHAGVGKLGAQIMEREGTQLTQAVAEHATISKGLGVAPDFAPGLWRASPNTANRAGGRTPKFVVIHTCEGGYSGCVNTFLKPNSVSAHYVVSTTGEVTQMVREAKRASHISATYNCANNSQQMCTLNGAASNDLSVGIEHAGSASQSRFPVPQISASAKLVCSITKRWNIPRDRFHIVGHGQLQPWNRTDPGRNWPWADYVSRINTACAR